MHVSQLSHDYHMRPYFAKQMIGWLAGYLLPFRLAPSYSASLMDAEFSWYVCRAPAAAPRGSASLNIARPKLKLTKVTNFNNLFLNKDH